MKRKSRATLRKVGKIWEVRMTGRPDLAKLPGVTVENPEAAPERQVCVKVFRNKHIYRDYERFRRDRLTGPDLVALAANGYSTMDDPDLLEAYVQASKGLLVAVYWMMKRSIPRLDIRLIDGGSKTGIDKALLLAADELKIPHVSHSCPEFMFWVEDDNDPVFVAPDQDAYSDTFIQSSHILLACNGGKQAFHMDIKAALDYEKDVVLVDLLGSLGREVDSKLIGSNKKIVDAVSSFMRLVHVATRHLSTSSFDKYSDLVLNVGQIATSVARSKVSPQAGYENPLPHLHSVLLGSMM